MTTTLKQTLSPVVRPVGGTSCAPVVATWLGLGAGPVAGLAGAPRYRTGPTHSPLHGTGLPMTGEPATSQPTLFVAPSDVPFAGADARTANAVLGAPPSRAAPV